MALLLSFSPTPTFLVLFLFFLLQHQALQVDAKSGQCLESKCRGTRIHPWVDNDLEITCWISLEEDVKDPKFCADGFVGHIVEDVPHEEVDGEMRAWYTCCEPEFDGVAQQSCKYSACSSPDWASGGNCWADGFQEPMSCGDSVYRYPHFTSQKSLIYFQFICCDTPQDGPETQELLISRIIWIILSSITLVVCSVFVVAILKDKTARSEGWNLYLVFLAIPDAICNLMIIIRNGLTIPGVPVSPSVHIFFASVEYFYASANLWLNGVIIAQVYYVLRNSGPQRKIPPPTGRLVVKQSVAVYIFAVGAFMWAYYLYARGLIDYSLTTVVNIWISTRALLVIPPLLFCIFVCLDVWCRKLLPRSGRTRVLSLYFLRVIVVFLVTWIPYFILYEVSWNITYSTWMVNCSYYLSSIQGTVSVLVAMSKPDVKEAVYKFLCGRNALQKKKRKKKIHKEGQQQTMTPAVSQTSEPSVPNEWYQEDAWEWGNYDLDAMLEAEQPQVPMNVSVPEKAPPRRTETASTNLSKGETFLDEDTAEDPERQKEKQQKEAKPVVEEDHGEWLQSFLERFRREQEEELQRVRGKQDSDTGDSTQMDEEDLQSLQVREQLETEERQQEIEQFEQELEV